MKLALLLLSYYLQDAGYTVAKLENGKCSACVRAGVKSMIWVGTCSSTLAWCPPYYDENGKYTIPPPCNRSICVHQCSNWHRVAEEVTQ